MEIEPRALPTVRGDVLSLTLYRLALAVPSASRSRAPCGCAAHVPRARLLVRPDPERVR